MQDPKSNYESVDSLLDEPSMSNSGTYDEREQELLKEIIEVKESLNIFEHRVLRGEIEIIDKNSNEKKWVLLGKQPVVNELGVREIMAVLSSKVTKAAKLTYKTEEEVYKDLYYFHMSLAETFAKRASTWELNIELMKTILDACINLVWDVESMSKEGFLSINLRSQYTKSDVSRTDAQPQKSGGFFSNLLGGGR